MRMLFPDNNKKSLWRNIKKALKVFVENERK